MSDSLNNIKKRKNPDDILSLKEILEDQINVEKDLLEEAENQESEKWGEEGKCTHDKGYIDQPVYACKTCIDKKSDKSPFGMCYGCSMSCHLYHDVYELFKKRSFKCDCGTSKSNGQKCDLTTVDKHLTTNTENKYNHNFNGKYCYCDSEYDYKEDMILCILCQDWFHEQCIKFNSKVDNIPDQEDFQDFICLDCVLKYDQFLLNYFDNISVVDKPTMAGAASTTKETNEKENVDIEKIEQQQENTCKKPNSKCNVKLDLFCKEDWRNQLCKCEKCIQFYKDQNIEFILTKEQEEDEEEKQGQETSQNGKINNLFEKSQDLFEKLVPGPQQQVLLNGYSEMKDKLRDLLTKKQNSNQVVTKQDIQSFFSELVHKKRSFGKDIN
ncbi:hypothetical protein CYY_007775 [Polysphondylium violaceum]|uniref:UBR-type domain-containing protein n=1 Tax=Polysphondylium violaceum TaxID=133409 RepID=A0A8J4PRE5_9MYCE|nr:hypothetical protein CYY_007775 [Polysphondylium violaceum]